MYLEVHKDSVGQSTPAGFAIDTKHVSTQVRVEDGGTVMIGGIYETNDNTNRAGVPGVLMSAKALDSVVPDAAQFIAGRAAVSGKTLP